MSSAKASMSSLTAWESRGFSTSASRATKTKGRVVVAGVCAEPDPYLPVLALLKELTIAFSVYYRPEEFEFVINAFETGQIDPEPLVTRIVALEQLDSAFASLMGTATDSKILVDPRQVPAAGGVSHSRSWSEPWRQAGGLRGTIHNREDLVGKATHAVESVLGTSPGPHQCTSYTGVGEATKVVQVGTRCREADLDGTGPTGRLPPARQFRHCPSNRLCRVIERDPAVPDCRRRGEARRARRLRSEAGGHGVWTGLGTNMTGSKSKNSPWCSTNVLAPQPLTHLDRLIHSPSPRGEIQTHRIPLGPEPAGPDPEFESSAARHVESDDSSGDRQRMAQADVVDVGAEANPLGLPGQERQVGEDLEHGDVGWNRRVIRIRDRTALQFDRKDQVLGHPDRLEAQLVSEKGGFRPQARSERCQCNADLHGAPFDRIPGGHGSRSGQQLILFGHGRPSSLPVVEQRCLR